MAGTDVGCHTPWPLVVTCIPLVEGRLRIRVIGDLDVRVAGRFCVHLAALVEPAARVVELDLAGVGFCDAAGVRELLALRHQVAGQQVRVLLVAAHPAVRFLLCLVGEQAWLRGVDKR
ncbi:STAS domain-containing protein [Actinoplanes sp. NPDC051346]|uniref:STAS domain-containing protein n=1 Tax=Actinoplanes sp. NPDC051346 TaxID=3155048 RepID=UPI00342C2B67